VKNHKPVGQGLGALSTLIPENSTEIKAVAEPALILLFSTQNSYTMLTHDD